MHRARKTAAVTAGGLLYAVCTAAGLYAESGCKLSPGGVFLRFAAALAIALPLLTAALRFGERRSETVTGAKPFRWKRAWVGIAGCWVPMAAVLFPGSFAYDVPFQLRQFFTGAFSSHHPLLHTLLLGGCVRLGQLLGSINAGAALYTLIQMLLLSLCFSLTCASLARQSGYRTARRAAFFFALYPMHMIMACNATKDVLFSGCLVLTLALAGEQLTGGLTKGRTAGMILAAALSILLRNNMVYALAAGLVLMLCLLRGRSLKCVGALGLALVLGVGLNAGLSGILHAEKGSPVEMLSLPIQQLGRANRRERKRLGDEERAAVDELFPGKAWKKYDATISDPLKFALDTEKLGSDTGKYLTLWKNLGLKYPKDYLDATILQTYAFWFPYTRYRVSGYYVQMGISDEKYDEWCDFERISDASPLPRLRAALSWRFGAQGAMQLPAVGYLFNMGLVMWVMFFGVLRSWYLGHWNRFALGMIPLCLWGTFLLGPVMAGRYAYSFMCILPVVLCLERRGPADEQCGK